MRSLLGIRFFSPVFPTFSGLGKVGVQGLKGFGNQEFTKRRTSQAISIQSGKGRGESVMRGRFCGLPI
jgi:hypothetical protein